MSNPVPKKKPYMSNGTDFHISGVPYKSRITGLIFDPYVKEKIRDSYGNQIGGRQKGFFFDTASISYAAQFPTQSVQRDVSTYIRNYRDTLGNLQVFQTALQQKMQTGRKQVYAYNVQQIAAFFPWMFSCQMLFQPLRSIIYCLFHNRPAQAAIQIPKTLQNDLINQQVNKALYHCFSNNTSLVMTAIEAFSRQHIGIIAAGYRTVMIAGSVFSNSLKTFLQARGQQVTDVINYVASTVIMAPFRAMHSIAKKGMSYFKNEVDVGQQSIIKGLGKVDSSQGNQEAYARKYFDDLAHQIFSQVRIYGQVLINIKYIRMTASRKLINGRLFYYYVQKPNLLFGMLESFLQVYKVSNNVLTLIPQGDFTLQFLRNSIVTDVLATGGRMLQSMKLQTTQTADQREPMQSFAAQYMNWPTNLPQMNEAQKKVALGPQKGFLTKMFSSVPKTTKQEQNAALVYMQSLLIQKGWDTQQTNSLKTQIAKLKAAIIANP